MSKTQAKLRKAKDEALKIEARAELAISMLQKIAYKQKPNHDDIIEIQKVIKILEDK